MNELSLSAKRATTYRKKKLFWDILPEAQNAVDEGAAQYETLLIQWCKLGASALSTCESSLDFWRRTRPPKGPGKRSKPSAGGFGHPVQKANNRDRSRCEKLLTASQNQRTSSTRTRVGRSKSPTTVRLWGSVFRTTLGTALTCA